MSAVSKRTLEAEPQSSREFGQQKVRLIVEWNSRQAKKRAVLDKAMQRMQETAVHITDADTFFRWKNGPWRRMMTAYREVEPRTSRVDRYGNLEKL